ncbi:MAG: hypothetical protein R6W77_04180 [Trueperaceae bacterium]
MSATRRYLVTTDHGDVVVEVNAEASGLDADFLRLHHAGHGVGDDLDTATPLRAFGAKMVDLIELHGVGAFDGSDTMREMLVREKATHELKRIERFARAAKP